MYSYVTTTSRLDVAMQSIRCAHISPSAPDSVWCHPFKDTDPFILQDRPHIYIVGNQPQFESFLDEGTLDDGSGYRTRIVLLPKFSTSGTIVLVNTETLEVKPISFQAV